VTPHQIEDAIRAAAALTAAIAARNRDDAHALLAPGPSWCLALWLARTLESAGTDPTWFAAAIIADSVAFEAGQAA
jgi:hypothetical protein